MQEGLKKCTCCGEEKPYECFHKRSNAKDGYQFKCKACKSDLAKEYREKNHEKVLGLERAKREANADAIAQYNKEYAKQNREHLNKTSKRWYERNSEKVKESQRKYTALNSERINEYGRQWRKSNQALCNVWTADYRAKKAQATVDWADKDKIALFYAKAKRLSIWLEEEYHVDHIVPLRSKYVCGLHNEFNLQLLTKTENLQKLNSWWPDMP